MPPKNTSARIGESSTHTNTKRVLCSGESMCEGLMRNRGLGHHSGRTAPLFCRKSHRRPNHASLLYSTSVSRVSGTCCLRQHPKASSRDDRALTPQPCMVSNVRATFFWG
jgi:hypothetical protein